VDNVMVEVSVGVALNYKDLELILVVLVRDRNRRPAAGGTENRLLTFCGPQITMRQ
jgi:hypothetical protein